MNNRFKLSKNLSFSLPNKYKPLALNKHRYYFLYGIGGSGKSFSTIAILLTRDIYMWSIAFIRLTQKSLEATSIDEIQEFIKNHLKQDLTYGNQSYIPNQWHYLKNERAILKIDSQGNELNRISFFNAHNVEDLKSLSSKYNTIVYEEVSQLKEKDFLILTQRIRHKNFRHILIANQLYSSSHWLEKFKNKNNDTFITINTSIDDNDEYLDSSFRESTKQLFNDKDSITYSHLVEGIDIQIKSNPVFRMELQDTQEIIGKDIFELPIFYASKYFYFSFYENDDNLYIVDFKESDKLKEEFLKLNLAYPFHLKQASFFTYKINVFISKKLKKIFTQLNSITYQVDLDEIIAKPTNANDLYLNVFNGFFTFLNCLTFKGELP